MQRAWRAGAAAILAALVSTSAVSWAQEAPASAALQEAQQRFDLATRHADQGDWALALTEWERVRTIMEAERHPRARYVLYNIGRANQELGRTGEAIAAYEGYLDATRSDAEAPNRGDAERRLRELRSRRELEGARSPGSSPGSFAPSPLGIVIGSVGAATMIAGGVLGGVALAQGDAARTDCEGTRCTPDAHAAIGEAQTYANAADGLLFGGLAVLAAGMVLTFVLGESGETHASAACDGQGCSATVRGRF